MQGCKFSLFVEKLSLSRFLLREITVLIPRELPEKKTLDAPEVSTVKSGYHHFTYLLSLF